MNDDQWDEAWEECEEAMERVARAWSTLYDAMENDETMRHLTAKLVSALHDALAAVRNLP